MANETTDWQDESPTAVEPAPAPTEEPEPEPETDDEALPAWPLVPQPPSDNTPSDLQPGTRFSDLSNRNFTDHTGTVFIDQQALIRERFGNVSPDSYWRFEGFRPIRAVEPFAGRVTLDADDDKPDLRPFVIERVWVSGAKGVIAGQDKSIKSTTADELVVSLVTGTPMYGMSQFAFNEKLAQLCVIIQTERTDGQVRNDMKQMAVARGVDPATVFERVRIMSQKQALTFSLLDAACQKHLRDLAAAGYRYVILDPLYELIGEADIADRSGNMPGILRFLTELQVLGMAPIFTTLTGNGRLSMRALFGSKYIRLWIEGAIFTAWDDRHKLATVKFHAVRDGYGEAVYRLRGKGVGSWEPYKDDGTNEATDEQRTNQTNLERQAAKATRVSALKAIREANPEMSIPDFVQAMGEQGYVLSPGTVQRYITEMDTPE